MQPTARRRHLVPLLTVVAVPLMATAVLTPAAAAAPVGATVRASVASDGTPADDYSATPSISGDGNVVLFSSLATNLVTGFPSATGETALFTRDLRTGTTAVAGLAPDGRSVPMVTGNYDGDGSTVLFSSPALDRFAPGAPQLCSERVGRDQVVPAGCINVFARDTATGTTSRVSVAADGGEPNGRSDEPQVSADGRFVAFWSEASNLVADDTNGATDVFVRDVVAGTTTRLTDRDSTSYSPRISADGRFVAFLNDGVAADPALSPTGSSILVHDRSTGSTDVVPVSTADGTPVGSIPEVDVSSDGTLVAFGSYHAGLVAGDVNRDFDVFVLDRTTGALTLASRAPDGRQPRQSDRARFSADGRSLLFRGYGAVTPDATDAAHLYVRDLAGGELRLVDVNTAGEAANGYSDTGFSSISADGTRVAFSSEGTNLAAGDGNGTTDIFVRDLRAPAPAEPGEATAELTGGGTVTTDPTGAGATAEVPVQTAITAPASVAGTVSVQTQETSTATPTGISLLGTELVLEGPAATAQQPYTVAFTVESTELGTVDPADLQVFRNGEPVADCSDPVAAVPDPCVASRSTVSGPGTDAVVTVRTSHFSTWNLGTLDYTLTGPSAPVDPLPAVNSARAGSAIPVKFGLGGDRGLDVFADGYPVLRAGSSCGTTTDEVEQTVSAPASALRYDAAARSYVYVWKTDRARTGCTDLVLRFRDGSELRAAFLLR